MNVIELPTANTVRHSGADGRLTVVLPTYNHGHFIAEAIDSLYAQTRRPDRIIVLDDASTDDTADVVERYRARQPAIEFIREEQNRGVVAMMNRGLTLTQSEFVSFLAADDFVLPELYAKSCAVMDRHPGAAACGVRTLLIAEDGTPLPSSYEPDFGRVPRYLSPGDAVSYLHRLGGLFGGNGAVYRTAMLRDQGGFASDLLSFCDGYAVQVLAARNGVCVVPEPLAVWRQRAGGFAAQSRVDAASCYAIFRAVEARRVSANAGLPAVYQRRLESRLRYAAAVAAVCEPRPNRAVLTGLFPSAAWLWLSMLPLARTLGGKPVVEAMLSLRFRPFDVVPGFGRRLWANARNLMRTQDGIAK